MGKRKANDPSSKEPTRETMDIDGGDDDGSDDDIDMLNVDFEFFDYDPSIDFHGLKNLLRQLLDVDNQLFDLSELADTILTAPSYGSTIKCEGPESDPYAFLTVVDIGQHRQDKKVVKDLLAYLLVRNPAPDSPLHSHLSTLINSTDCKLGLVFTERFINMPHQTIPPLYNLLLSELRKENANFTHYLIISKSYTEVASKLDTEDNPPAKKKKNQSSSKAQVLYFHPEDEVLQKHALAFSSYEYERQEDEGASDAKRTFSELGIRPQGSLILLEGGEKFASAVKAMEEYLV